MLWTVPAESLAYHGERNHFSNWLKARTEFALAHSLRPRKVADFRHARGPAPGPHPGDPGVPARAGPADRGRLRPRRRSTARAGFCRLGGGSLGGKARGLAFVNLLLDDDRAPRAVPRRPDLGPARRRPRRRTSSTSSSTRTTCATSRSSRGRRRGDPAAASSRPRFPRRSAQRPGRVPPGRAATRSPSAPRASSRTRSTSPSPASTRRSCCRTTSREPHARLVAAPGRRSSGSTPRRSRTARRPTSRATPYRLEEEKMAVDPPEDRRVGARRPLLPDLRRRGAVAQLLSRAAPMRTGGRDRGRRARLRRERRGRRRLRPLLPALPAAHRAVLVGRGHPPELAAGVLRAPGRRAGRRGGALRPATGTSSCARLRPRDRRGGRHARRGRLDVLAGERRRLRRHLAPGRPARHASRRSSSTASSRSPRSSRRSSSSRRRGTGAPVEIEFAVEPLRRPPEPPKEFGFLQLRPLALSRELDELEIGDVDPRRTSSARAGRSSGTDGSTTCATSSSSTSTGSTGAEPRRRGRDRRLQRASLVAAGDPLPPHRRRAAGARPTRSSASPSRGTRSPGARVIVEAGFRDFQVTPSQGTHFFQNLTANSTGYFTVNPELGDGSVDWDVARGAAGRGGARSTSGTSGSTPRSVKMNGRRNEGIILKPAGAAEPAPLLPRLGPARPDRSATSALRGRPGRDAPGAIFLGGDLLPCPRRRHGGDAGFAAGWLLPRFRELRGRLGDAERPRCFLIPGNDDPRVGRRPVRRRRALGALDATCTGGRTTGTGTPSSATPTSRPRRSG